MAPRFSSDELDELRRLREEWDHAENALNCLMPLAVEPLQFIEKDPLPIIDSDKLRRLMQERDEAKRRYDEFRKGLVVSR